MIEVPKPLAARLLQALRSPTLFWTKLRRAHAGPAQRIALDYPVDARPRYGWGSPPHAQLYELIDRGRASYAETLRSCLRFERELLAIPATPPAGASEPSWKNDWFVGIDLVALYSLVALRQPRLYLEIGSGQSTSVARRAVRDHALSTRIVSLDPEPRSEIDAICDEVVRSRLEDCDTALFKRLQPGDMLFFDGSHRSFQNSDVTVFFLEVLQSLPSGVLVHVHDIWLPYDYPRVWSDRYYSEQYLLAVYLLSRGDHARVVLPNAFISEDEALRSILGPLWAHPELAGVDRYGVSFWLET